MTIEHTTADRQRDPVCGMSVRVDVATEDGLLTEHDAHTYYFCRRACLDEFLGAPSTYVATHAHASQAAPAGTPDIDEGMRRWYDSCSCCLSDAYPDVKAALDAERAANETAPAGPGICEVAEAAETAQT